MCSSDSVLRDNCTLSSGRNLSHRSKPVGCAANPDFAP
jgi:hypothetical protein